MIPDSFITSLLERADIEAIIAERVNLIPAGGEFKGLCPFHGEKTPSFTVSPSKQFYHCFGCGAHGSVIGFVMQYEGLDFIDAVHWLADRFGMEVPKAQGAPVISAADKNNIENLLRVLERADHYFRQQLRLAEQAKTYFIERGISGKTAQQFGIGYAPAGWDKLAKHLLSKHCNEQQMLEAGLVLNKGQGLYDRFRDRVCFPIRDKRGRTIAFGARTIGKDEPKYLNSPETPLFKKGYTLYGLYEGRKSAREENRLVFVEGYMDVVMLAEYGINYACAGLGTALTGEQIQLGFRTASELIFCFDGDSAGRKAAFRAVERAMPYLKDGRKVRIMLLPEGEDPDSMVQKIGREEFEQALDKAQTLTEYIVSYFQQRGEFQSIEAKANLVNDLKLLLNETPDSSFKQLFQQELCARFHISENLLNSKNSSPSIIDAHDLHRQKLGVKAKSPSLIRRTIQLLLIQPSILAKIDLKPEKISLINQSEMAGTGLLVALIEAVEAHDDATTAKLVELFRNDQNGKYLSKLVSEPVNLPSETMIQQEFEDCFNRVCEQITRQNISYLKK